MFKFWESGSRFSSGSIHGASWSEDFWRQSVHGGWATLIALLLIFLWHSFKTISFSFSFSLFSRSASSSSFNSNSKSKSKIVSASEPGEPESASRTAQFGIPEIVSDEDLMFLLEKLDGNSNENERWDNVIDKSNTLLSYSAKCCKPKDAPLKYLSVTVFEDCSTEVLRDFYMDNDYRKQWDKTLVDHWQLLVDENTGVEVGRTIKKFPLLTPREYVLAWRLWEGKNNTYYCFIKECEYPSAPKQKKYVRVSYFRSGWRIRKVPGRNASEIKMFHQEDAGLNVEMAKLAFSKGIWSYICKMDGALRKYPLIRQPQSPSVNAVTLMKMVPAELDTLNNETSQSTTVTPASVQAPVGALTRKLSRRPSKKVVANSLLLIGGLICLTRGHSSLSAKVAMAYILNKMRKRGASSSSSRSNQSIGT